MMHDIEQVDKDLIVETIKFINKSCHGDGAILVFLPGKPLRFGSVVYDSSSIDFHLIYHFYL